MKKIKEKTANGKSLPMKDKKENDEKDINSTELQWKNMTVREKFNYMRSHITVEPILLCYVMPSCLSSLATANLNLEKACRVNLQYPDHVCDALTLRQTANYTMEESEVQKLVSEMTRWKTVLQSSIPCLLILFLGAWSDRVGKRKFCILLPIFGEMVTTFGIILNAIFFYQLPMEVAGFTEGFFPAISGGWVTMFMGVFSYIADITTEESRTLRIGMANLFCNLGIPIGMSLSGILLKWIGFYGVSCVSLSLHMFGLIYGYYTIREPERIKPQTEITGWRQQVKSFFDWRHVRDTFSVAFKNGPNSRRLRVSVLIVVVCVVIGPMHGEMSLMYLFTRYKFNWDEVAFSIFSTYNVIVNLVGTLFSVGVFSHYMKLDDAIIGILSSMSKIVSSFMYAFAATDWQIYIAPLLEILNGTSFIAMRSIASKLVSSDELGKVNSLFGIAEGIMPVVYVPMYTSLYVATMETMPGAFFLLGAALTVPAVLIFAWIYILNKREAKQKLAELEKEKKITNEKMGEINSAFQMDDEVKIKNQNNDTRINNMVISVNKDDSKTVEKL